MGEKTVWSKKKSGRQFPAISKWSNEIGGRKKVSQGRSSGRNEKVL